MAKKPDPPPDTNALLKEILASSQRVEAQNEQIITLLTNLATGLTPYTSTQG